MISLALALSPNKTTGEKLSQPSSCFSSLWSLMDHRVVGATGSPPWCLRPFPKLLYMQSLGCPHSADAASLHAQQCQWPCAGAFDLVPCSLLLFSLEFMAIITCFLKESPFIRVFRKLRVGLENVCATFSYWAENMLTLR